MQNIYIIKIYYHIKLVLDSCVFKLVSVYVHSAAQLLIAYLWLLVQLFSHSSKVAANDLVAPAARDKLLTG